MAKANYRQMVEGIVAHGNVPDGYNGHRRNTSFSYYDGAIWEVTNGVFFPTGYTGETASKAMANLLSARKDAVIDFYWAYAGASEL